MKQDLRIARVAGIDISLHWTFFLLVAWILFSNASGKTAAEMFVLLAFVLLLFSCVILHELGHALTAKSFGIRTRSIKLYPIGGVASLEKIPEKPGQELLVTLAGPAVNLFIAGSLYLWLFLSGDATGMWQRYLTGKIELLPSLFAANLSLAVFNLIPAFPMDGGRVLRAILCFFTGRDKATRIAMRIGHGIAILFILAGLSFNSMLVIIGVFIFIAGQGEAAFVHARTVLSAFRASDAVMHQYASIEANAPLSEAVRLLLDGPSSEMLVTDNGQMAGTLTRDQIIRALSEKSSSVAVRDVMTKGVRPVSHHLPLDQVYEELMTNRSAIVPVTENGRLLGLIGLENILEFIMVKDALAKHKD